MWLFLKDIYRTIIQSMTILHDLATSPVITCDFYFTNVDHCLCI